MIHCSFVEGFSSPPSSGLLILEVEGSIIIKELDFKLCLTPMVFMLMEDSEVWVQREKDKEKIRKMEKGDSSFSFYILVNYSFPSKNICSKVAPFQIY